MLQMTHSYRIPFRGCTAVADTALGTIAYHQPAHRVRNASASCFLHNTLAVAQISLQYHVHPAARPITNHSSSIILDPLPSFADLHSSSSCNPQIYNERRGPPPLTRPPVRASLQDHVGVADSHRHPREGEHRSAAFDRRQDSRAPERGSARACPRGRSGTRTPRSGDRRHVEWTESVGGRDSRGKFECPVRARTRRCQRHVAYLPGPMRPIRPGLRKC